jgi:hypothetical protein
VIKHNFDQTPKLLENFDQLIRSSEIRSSDPLSFQPEQLHRCTRGRGPGAEGGGDEGGKRLRKFENDCTSMNNCVLYDMQD